jgi:signal transduction histidine kinase
MVLRGRWPRSSVWALIAVVVPAMIVAGLGWVSLRQWEASAELLFREQARDMAAMAVDKIQMVLRQSEDAALADLQARVVAGPRASALDEFLARAPLVQRLYLFDRRGHLVYPAAPHEADAAVFAALLAEVSQGRWERGGRRDVVIGEQSLLTTLLAGSDGAPMLAALTRSVDGLRREVFAKTFKALAAPTIFAVIDGQGRAVYSSERLDRADLVIAVPFREGLSHWRLALYQPRGQSPRETVRRQVAVFTGAFAVLIGVIGVGIVATWRLVRRETEMARLKSDFVANVSHDLKTPVSVIRMFGETLEMGRVPDEAGRREYYRVITRESERLSRLIDNVLDFSRIEGGRRRYELAPTAVEPLVRETLEAFSYPLMQGGFKVEVDVAPDLPAVPLDADAVGQALANLIDNAIKYSGDRHAVRVEVLIVEGELALSVADEGLGIPAAEQTRIFEKFYRVGRSETQGRRGSGVGLALVRHVAEAHGGRVTVRSEPGAGSRFTLWLPLGGRARA